MPRLPLSPETIHLLANYLLQQEESAQPEGYLSLIDQKVISLSSGGITSGEGSARLNYLTYCAACHGEQGKGDGFNARFLPVRPTAHADASMMEKRPDDTLFDGVHSGGYILNKSRMMPAWGQSLSTPEIKDLVAFMRTLCRCLGPAWSRDN